MTLFRVAILLPSVLLAGCSSLTAQYVRPALPNAPALQDSAGISAPVAAANWWRSFGDPKLDLLVEAVLQNNNDILAATLRVRKAQLQADLAGAAKIPVLSGTGNAQTSMVLAEGTSSNSFTLGLGATYELDLWGRLSSGQDIAALQAAASIEDVESARTTIIASTIEAYWRLAFTNQDLAIARAGLDAAREVESLVKSQAAVGAATELELAEVRQSVESQAAQLSDLEQNRVVLRNALGVLLNGVPSPVPEPQLLPRRTPVQITAGLPAELLSRRPDLRAAELRLRASLRTVDNTRASLYPQISLTGDLGTSSTDLLGILANPVAALGAGLVLPFLNFKDGELRVKVSEVDYQVAVSEFRASLLTAFSDTSNALSARTALNEKSRRLRAALEAAQAADRLTGERYRAGAVALRIWLDAQERSRAGERALAANRLEQLLAEVQIFRALGGSPSPSVAL
ncbi:efflux transporter outer membrane subunit [Devosia sp.]|uniref:efflux transporter outer membrane subunit n=1 Tax=Devosia sp. TaxID=1871048 RepID=UPI0019FECB38|nr:efflux transporter outer membrane subunit [Devosia sp.]MBE0579570.1 efflux transporter outer membrane subunit [Devosia sp.]